MFSLLLTFLVLSLLLFLGILVLKNNPRSLTNRTFFLLTVILVSWAVFNYLENENTSFYYRSIFLRLDFFFGIFIGYFWLLFCKVFLSLDAEFKNFKFRYLLLLPILLIAPLAFTDLIIKNILITEIGINFDFGSLFIFYGLILCSYVFYGVYILYRKYKERRGVEKLQAIYVLLGLFFSAFFSLFLNLVLQNFISAELYRFSIYSLGFLVGFTSYAILRYRLMDVRVIIRRSAVFTILVLLITALYAILAYFLSQVFAEMFGIQSLILNGIVMAILVAIGFEPLKKILSVTTDKYLFKAPYNPQQVLGEFSEKLTSTLDLEVLGGFIVTKLAQVFKPTFVSLFLLNEKSGLYERQSLAGKAVAELQKIDKKLFNNIYTYLRQIKKEKDIFIREEIKKINEQMNNPILGAFYQELEKFGVNLLVPLYSQEKLVGILFFGDKKSGDVYSDEDIRMTEIIAGQSAVAIQNAQLFEEQKHFTAHLKVEVAKATKELQSANVQLKKLDEAKSEFISIASHQLRTPLTIIKGYVSMIQQGDFGKVPEKLMSPCDKIAKSTMRIIGLVEDLLNISRIESGRMKFDLVDVNLPELVQDVFEELEQHAKNRGLEFSYIKPVKKIPLLKLDRNKIREVLMNLMDNAIKYTEKGWVKVRLEKMDHRVHYIVSDSGRGIAPDEMPLLFQKFSRAKGVQLMHTEGTGLGLYIAKKILQKHKAKIWAESEGSDKGSTFIIEFKV